MREVREEDDLLAVVQKQPVPFEPPELERLFQAHHERVFRAAYRVTGNASDAEDVLQTVFLRLARREEGRPDIAHLESYLYRAAVNAALDLLRSRSTSPVPLDEAAHASSDPAGQDEMRTWLRQALARLNPKHAEMFVLRHLEGLDHREIGRLMGTNQAVVAVTLHRVRGQLQKEFRQQAGGKS